MTGAPLFEGQLFSLDSPLARAIHAEHPEYLKPAR